MSDSRQDIFENPQFFEDGPTASDVRQGNNGDCWFLSALCALCNKQDLVNRLCVARDEVVGVYGFVFHRGMPISIQATVETTNKCRWRMDTNHHRR